MDLLDRYLGKSAAVIAEKQSIAEIDERKLDAEIADLSRRVAPSAVVPPPSNLGRLCRPGGKRCEPKEPASKARSPLKPLGITALLDKLDGIKDSIDALNKKLDRTNMTAQELTDALNSAGDQLEKAKGEILAEIEKIKAGTSELTPEQQASVQRIVAIAQSLDDVVPDNVG
jgi:hypothetical protein